MAYDILENGCIEQGSKGFFCIVGHRGGEATLTRVKEHVWYFNRLFVHKELRGKEIGTALVEKVVNFCKTNNVSLINDINAYGDLDLKQLKQFYIKNGFNETLLEDKVVLLRKGGCMEEVL